MSRAAVSRRDFFRRAAAGGAALVLARGLALAQPPIGEDDAARPKREALNEAEWRTLEAITARILPSDGGPGAIEAGCIWFIDRALAHEDAHQRPLYAGGLLGVEALARARFSRAFVELSDAERDELLRLVESGEVQDWPTTAGAPASFFAAVRRHVILGFLSDPSYGGNRDYVGWRVAGHPGPRHHHGAKLASPATPQQLVGGQPVVPIWEDTAIRLKYF